MRKTLIDDGWKTPSTYVSSQYGKLPDCPGVYIVLEYLRLFDPNGPSDEHKPVYIGMARNLRKRHEGHEVIKFIRIAKPKAYLQVWFKTFPISLIRTEENKLIKRYNPEYNIKGCARHG